jgi:hypothetical protein
MKLEALDADKARIIRLQSDIVEEGRFFLAGGTGLAIRLGAGFRTISTRSSAQGSMHTRCAMA